MCLDGEDIEDSRADELVSKGLTLVPEGRRLFKHMTVQENFGDGCLHGQGQGESSAEL